MSKLRIKMQILVKHLKPMKQMGDKEIKKVKGTL